MKNSEHIKAYAEFFENLSQATSKEIYLEIMDETIYFEDPFNKVNGIDHVITIMCDIFDKLDNPSFNVNDRIVSDNVGYLHWTFTFYLKSSHEQRSFEGMSKVTFGDNGKVVSHVDYWDASTHFYELFPILGSIIRWIKRKMSH